MFGWEDFSRITLAVTGPREQKYPSKTRSAAPVHGMVIRLATSAWIGAAGYTPKKDERAMFVALYRASERNPRRLWQTLDGIAAFVAM